MSPDIDETEEVTVATCVVAVTDVAQARRIERLEVIGTPGAGIVRAGAAAGLQLGLIELAGVLLRQSQCIQDDAGAGPGVLHIARVVRADPDAAPIGVCFERNPGKVGSSLGS